MEDLFRLSRNFINVYNRAYQRYFLKKYPLDSRLSIIVGQRGIGKTTIIIQYILNQYQDRFTKKALYIQSDHFLMKDRSLYSIAEDFYQNGGLLLCIDEIHKYSNWSQELKSIHDTFPKLKVIASGSSALKIYQGSHDLSRRAVIYKMFGLSLREFIELVLKIDLPSFSISTIVDDHDKIFSDIVQSVEEQEHKILALFKSYLDYGYYPYFLNFDDKSSFLLTLEQSIRTTLESDLISVHPTLSGISIKKIRQLLMFIAESVPFMPDMNKIKKILNIGDVRTLKNYLSFLEDAGLIYQLQQKGSGIDKLDKPEKIYLNNCNLIRAITDLGNPNIGNIRETFFLNAVSSINNIQSCKKGDFFVDNKFTFEIGGKNKDQSQIKNVLDAYLALDDIESGFGRKIPLWLFGFLY
jgi:uncharacterized protein